MKTAGKKSLLLFLSVLTAVRSSILCAALYVLSVDRQRPLWGGALRAVIRGKRERVPLRKEKRTIPVIKRKSMISPGGCILFFFLFFLEDLFC